MKCLKLSFSFIFLFLLFSIVNANGQPSNGYCANPYVISLGKYCNAIETITAQECCPDETPYGTDTIYPFTKQECESAFFNTVFSQLNARCQVGCCFNPNIVSGCYQNPKLLCETEGGDKAKFSLNDPGCTIIPECTVGCCCDLNINNNLYYHESYTRGSCDDKYPGTQEHFFTDLTTEQCEQQCRSLTTCSAKSGTVCVDDNTCPD